MNENFQTQKTDTNPPSRFYDIKITPVSVYVRFDEDGNVVPFAFDVLNQSGSVFHYTNLKLLDSPIFERMFSNSVDYTCEANLGKKKGVVHLKWLLNDNRWLWIRKFPKQLTSSKLQL